MIVMCQSRACSTCGRCYSPNVGEQTSRASSGLSVARTTLDRVGPDRVSERRIPRLYVGRSQREAHGLEFMSDHSQGFAPA
jgi:hypothetical protein